MAKKKLETEQAEKLKAFLEKNVDSIVEAEVKTFRETDVSTHNPRVYIVTTMTIGLAGLNIPQGKSPDRVIKEVVEDYKTKERQNLTEEMVELYDMYGSHVAAILSFLPGNMFTGNLENASKEEQDIMDKISDGRVRIEDIRINPEYSQFKHLISDVINIQINTFYSDKMLVYKVIEHNDEVLDMPLVHEIDFRDKDSGSGGAMRNVSKLIEVEG